DRSSESSEAPLDEVKARVAAPTARCFLAGNEQRLTSGDNSNRRRRHARQVHPDLHRIVGLVDVDGRRAFARQARRGTGPAEFRKNPPCLPPEIANLRWEDNRLDSGAHRRIIAHLRSAVRGQRSEVRGQRSGVRGQGRGLSARLWMVSSIKTAGKQEVII